MKQQYKIIVPVFVISAILIIIYLMKGGPGGKKTIVLLHMNGCGHCEALMPTWDRLKREFTDLEDVEYSADPTLADKYNVSGFPAIVLTSGGEYVDTYSGDRSYEDLSAYIRDNQ